MSSNHENKNIKHIDEDHTDDCDCGHDHHNHHSHHDNHDDGHDHEGCACEGGILENIDHEKERSKKPLIILTISAILFGIGIFISTLNFDIFNFFNQEIISQIIYLIVVVIVGQGIIRHGISSLLKKEIKIELLITIATFGAFIMGEGAEGASLMLLFFFAEYLEHFALDRSKKSLSQLVKLSPDKAIIKRKKNKTLDEFEEIEVDVNNLKLDDVVIVKPGDKIPIDGMIVKGVTSVNQSSITGESLPVSKQEGNEVFASTINEEGYIEIKVTKKSNETIFSKIVDLIKESEEKKAKINLLIDKFAKYYTPSIIAIAAIVAIFPPLLFNQPFSDWFYRALVLLVISCPCGLVISTPVSMVSAITAGTKNGIIIKGGEYIEELSKIKAVLFDKTGTLTEGNLKIDDILINNENTNNVDNDINKIKLMEIACSLENKSKHPISNAFNEYQKNNNIKLYEVDNFKSISGKGLQGTINGETIYLGRKELFNHNEKIKDIIEQYYENNDLGKTSVIVGNENEILGFISLNDKIRDNSQDTIAQLKKKSIETIMLTGDNSSTAENVSNYLGLDKYYSDLLPEDKVNIVEEISNKFEDIAMIGDGVNDTPSLARANVGIAMGMGGSDVAIETADIVLMQDNISKIDYLINLANKTMGVIKQNITASLVVKGTLAVLGVIGYVTLWEAVLIGDMGLTLLVVANALRINKN